MPFPGLPPSARNALAAARAETGDLRRDWQRLDIPTDDRPWMKLTGYDQATGFYAWTEQGFDTDGDFMDLPWGRSGTVDGLDGETQTKIPGREMNGGTVPDFPFFVRGELSILTADGTVQYQFSVGSDRCFLAILTAKNFDGPFIRYSWLGVTDTEVLSDPTNPTSPKTIVYTLTDASGSPDDHPAYHEQNIDLVVCGQSSGPSAGSPVLVGPACYCFGMVSTAHDNGDGTYTWTFINLACGEDGSLTRPLLGDFAPCQAQTPCSGDSVLITAPTGTYATAPGTWAQLPTVCRTTGDEVSEACVVRLCKGRGDWYFVDHEPRWEFIRKHGDPDANGFYAGELLRWDGASQTWKVFDAHVLVTDVNAFS